MKKLFITILLLIFLSGCSVTYEVSIKKDKIKEKISLIETNQNLFDVENSAGWTPRQLFESLLNNSSDEFSMKNYSIKSLNSDTQLGVEYYSDEIEELMSLAAINQCYISPKVIVEDDIVTLNTGDNFKCYEYYENLDTIKIILKSDYRIISSNADLVENNKHIWNITKEGNKQIEFSYDRNNIPKETTLKIIISVVIFAIIVVLICYVYKKRKQENNI